MKKLFIIILLLNLFATQICFADTVVYNTKTGKIHAIWCKWAEKCTVNCIKLERREAINRGGIPCKVCNGGK